MAPQELRYWFIVIIMGQIITLGCLFLWTTHIYCAVQGKVC